MAGLQIDALLSDHPGSPKSCLIPPSQRIPWGLQCLHDTPSATSQTSRRNRFCDLLHYPTYVQLCESHSHTLRLCRCHPRTDDEYGKIALLLEFPTSSLSLKLGLMTPCKNRISLISFHRLSINCGSCSQRNPCDLRQFLQERQERAGVQKVAGLGLPSRVTSGRKQH